ncbi:hypothetical protein HYY73_05645 [Candidatus Woesearchaeota archaeon]|nr:hypothetical protein [Candidatus Woesearchaeota archaeon]
MAVFSLLALSLLALLLLPMAASAAQYVAKVQLAVEKPFYGAGEELHVSGSVLLSNLSANDTSFLAVSGASVNISISNSSSNGSVIRSNYTMNTSADGTFKSRSDNFLTGIAMSAPVGEGYYNISASYLDPNNLEWKATGTIRVFSSSIDHISISPEKARYYPDDAVPINLRALKEVGDRKVSVANVSINGSLRYTNRTVISTFSCTTNNGGVCVVTITAPSTAATYLLEANNFLSTSAFVVVPFEAFVYVKDSTGKSFKEIFKANELATIEVNVKLNGSLPTGDFVFNGTITDSNSNIITNINSTALNSNNSYNNRFSFTTTNAFTNGVYYVSVTVYKTGASSRVSASTSFQVRSWSLSVVKGAQNSGFDYEYTSFPDRNVSFEIYPKEYENGTVITGINSSQFNITLKSKTGGLLAIGNSTWNASCSSSGCYEFAITMPSAAGGYLLTVSLNYTNGEVQTVHRIVSVTTTSLSATPSNADGQFKELFGTSESVYITLSAKNTTSTSNITDVLVESVIYQNGTKFNFSEVALWDNVSSNNSVLEWAWNGSAQRIKLDAPKTGGNYLVNVFVNNRSAAASATFSVNPYTVCGAAKSTVGTVDSSTSFYVWQYKTTDTVYLELKVSQAQNGIGKATANSTGSGSFHSSYYGMGNACSIDTTKVQAITNATVVVEAVYNLQTGTKATLNTSATSCSADDNSGTYTCTVKPESKWDGGRYAVKLKVTGSDGDTVDRADTIFEARAFYLWAYSNSWTNKPTSNITYNVQLYEAGTNWWSNAGGSTGGITGEVAIQKVEYNGKDGEWLWPPIDIGYNTTGLNASNVSNGRGTFTLTTDRLPRGKWEPGYYVITIKGTNTASGESDYGQAWLGIRQWETYATPVDTSGSNIQYKDSFGTKENVTLFVRITNAGDWSDSGNTNLAGGANVSVGVKKLQYYRGGSLSELNKSAYSFTYINVTTSSPWYSSGNSGTHNKYFLNLTPASGRWDGGWYSVILDINSTETGYGWFSVIAFGVDTQPTDSSGAYTYSSRGSGPRYFNVTTTKSRKTYYSYYKANDYINTTVKDVMLSVWREDTWASEKLEYPEDLNISPYWVNGSALVIVNKSGNWVAGYYWGEITMQDAENSTGTGYLWFSIRSFRVDTSIRNYTIDTDANVSVDLNTRQPDWANSSVVYGNYTITSIYEDVWSGTGRSRTTYTNYRPNSSETFNGTVILNITPNAGSWGSGSYGGGYHYLSVVVKDNADNTPQTGWISFRAVPFSITVDSVPNQYSFTQTSNVTVNVTVKKSASGAATPANLTRAFEYTYPTQTEYAFAVGKCTSTSNGSACQVNGKQNITLVAPSGGWPAGWHYIYLEFTPAAGGSKTQADNSVWFNAVQAYDGYFNNVDEGGYYYKYYFGLAENLTIKIIVRNSNYVPQNVNVTKVEVSEDGDTCWSEYCKTYGNYSYVVQNGTGGTGIAGNGTIRITKPATGWKRGPHSIRATVEGSAGNAVIKTGYAYMKDISVPNITIISPTNGLVITNTTFLFNATSNENVVCYLNIVDFDRFSNWYCGSGANSTDAACNSSRFNGSTQHYTWVYYPPWGSMNTGGMVHHYSVNTEGWTNQDYGIYTFCSDSDWNYAQARVAFTLNVSVAVRPVTVNLTSPANSATVNTTNTTFRYNVSGPVSANMNCSIYVNVSNTWNANKSTSFTIVSTNGTNTTANNFALNGFNNGTYVWNTYCYHTTNTTNAAWAPSNFTFTAAINSTSNSSNTTHTPVAINLTRPANNSVTNSSPVNFTYNASGPSAGMACSLWSNSTGVWKANSTNSSATPGVQNVTHTFVNGTYVWNSRCEDNSNSSNYGWAASNFTLTVVNVSSSTSTSNITVNLSSPANNAVMNSSPVNFTYNVSGPASMNCSLWSNSTGVWKANITNSSATPGQQNASHNFVNGTYVWNSRCEDNSNSSNYGWAASNRTLVVTNVSSLTPLAAITINLSSPANNSSLSSSPRFIYNITGPSLLNCTVWGNFTGTWAANLTNNSVGPGRVDTGVSGVSAGFYKWNSKCVNASDSTSYAWAPINWTFGVDDIG